MSCMYFSEEVRRNIAELVELEKEYKQSKKSEEGSIVSKIANAQKKRNSFGSKAIEKTEFLANCLDDLLDELFG